MAGGVPISLGLQVGRGVKRKRALLKNLVAVGYSYLRLGRDLATLGEFAFRASLAHKLARMKASRESVLTETRDVGCTTVLEAVLDHFRETARERAARRLPPLLRPRSPRAGAAAAGADPGLAGTAGRAARATGPRVGLPDCAAERRPRGPRSS